MTRFARFFAVRELAMRTRGGWDATWRQTAAESNDPDVRAALKRRPPPMGRDTTTTRGPGAPPVQVRKPVRVGRAGPQRVGRVGLASVFEAETMQEFADRLAIWSGRR